MEKCYSLKLGLYFNFLFMFLIEVPFISFFMCVSVTGLCVQTGLLLEVLTWLSRTLDGLVSKECPSLVQSTDH